RELTSAAGRIAADPSGIGATFKDHAATLVEAARAAGEEATNLRAILDQQATDLSGIIVRTGERAEAMQRLVAEQAQSMRAAADTAEGRVAAIAEALENRLAALNASVGDAGQRLAAAGADWQP